MLDSPLSKIALGLLLLGAIFVSYGGVNLYREFGAEAEPTELPAADLPTRGLPANRHLRLLGATPAYDDLARFEVGGGRGSRPWQAIAVPLALPSPRPTGRGQVVAVAWLKSDRLPAFRAAADQGRVQGLRLRDHFDHRSRALDALARRYPRLELNAAPVLDFDRRPEDPAGWLRLLALGVTLSVLGGAGLRSRR
ncbi:MAG: hypothetical protein JSR82_21695 [Verrucomicrobia bacterium]|nr:hypothetical protein [Verrucomicrobiota bacterium]